MKFFEDEKKIKGLAEELTAKAGKTGRQSRRGSVTRPTPAPTYAAYDAIKNAGSNVWDGIKNIYGKISGAVNGGEEGAATGGATAVDPSPSTAPTAAAAGSSMMYDEWMKREKERLEELHDLGSGYVTGVHDAASRYADLVKKREEEAALAARTDAEKLAASELSRQTVQANDDFERSKLTYGAAAENLAQAGLTGSGYSDNLTRDAYAQRANALSGANLTYGAMMKDAGDRYSGAMKDAAAAHEDAKYKADAAKRDATYQLEMTKKEGEAALDESRYSYGQQLLNSYNQELLNVKNGYYTPEEIKQLGAAKGFSPEQIATLTEAATAYHAGTTNLDFKTAVESGSFDHAAIDAALADGSITKDQYDDMQATFRDQLDTDVTAFHTMDAAGNVVGMSRKDAEAMVKEYERHPWISDEQKKAIRKSFEELYCVKSFSATVNNGLPDGDPGSGDNFSVKVNGEKYRVQIGEKMSATSNVAIASSDVEDDEVFFYDGGLYVKHNGSVFSIEKRPWSNGSQAEELFDLAMNS